MWEWHADLQTNNVKLRIVDPWMDVMDHDFDDAEEETMLNIED